MEVMPVGMLDIVGAAHVDHKILAVLQTTCDFLGDQRG
jgi:inorganic pyrophosphatase